MCQMVSELLWVDVQFAENGQTVSLICANVVFFRENYNGSLRNFVITVKRYVKLIDLIDVYASRICPTESAYVWSKYQTETFPWQEWKLFALLIRSMLQSLSDWPFVE